MDSLDSLKLEAQFIFEQISLLKTYFDSTTKSSNLTLIEAKFARCEALKSQFSDLMKRVFIYNAASKTDDQCVINTGSFFDVFDVIHSSYLKNISAKSTGTQQPQPTQSPVSCLSLPPVNIPQFNGNLEQWQNFKSLYDSLVHVNTSLPIIQKFHLLKSYLVDEPLNLISHFKLEEANYLPAYKIIDERYSSTRRLVHYYLNKIFNYKNQDSKSYSNFLNVHVSCVQAIKSLSLADPLDTLLFCLLYQNMNSNDRHHFNNSIDSNQLPTCEDLFEFMKKRTQSYELQGDSKPSYSHSKSNFRKPNSQISLITKGQSSDDSKVKPKIIKIICGVCGLDHKIYNCTQFQSLSVSDRLNKIKALGRCKICLSLHKNECKSKSSCRHCNSVEHNSLLHEPNAQNSVGLFCLNKNKVQSQGQTLLSTVELEIQDSSGQFIRAKGILDNGSQVNALSHSLFKSLGLRHFNADNTVSGFSNSTSVSNKMTNCVVRSPYNWRTKIEFQAVIVDKICADLPKIQVPSDVMNHLKSLNLADKTFHEKSEIQVLLGSEIFSQILTNDPPVIIPGQPTAVNSAFGYFLTGNVNSPSQGKISLLINKHLDNALQKFWELEEVSVPHPKNSEEILTENHFLKTFSRNEEGRFQVHFCFKKDSPPLGSNRDRAIKRFFSLEKRLSLIPSSKEIYDQFFIEYKFLDHMRPAVNKADYILPHHAIYKPLSSSQVIRSVFNASDLDNFGFSLNSKLASTPKLQKDLPSILDSFRIHNYVICCDIQKMYRNILVHPEDRIWQHIFWRPSPDVELTEWELQTLTYGLSNSPYLAQRCIAQLVLEEGSNYPLASNSLNHHLYMDDCLTGSPDLLGAKKLQQEIIDLLGKACFKIKKWSSNSPSLLSSIKDEDKEKTIVFSDGTEVIKILGLLWCPSTDTFSYHVSPFSGKVTKRNILSYVFRIFDCNGYIGPIILKLKSFIQSLWIKSLDWDEELPSFLSAQWTSLTDQLHLLSEVKIPRKIFYPAATHRLLGFSDACETGIGCCVYIHVSQPNFSKCFLIRSKTKVAPLKPLTIPKAELVGALMLAKLVKAVCCESFPFNITETLYFTDSQIVLAWLRTPPYLLQTFTSNRVVQLLELSQPHQWFHIDSANNCADICSRGASVDQLLHSDLYWNGPAFTSTPRELWPIESQPSVENLPEMKRPKVSLVATSDSNLILRLIENNSSLPKVQRIVAYCLRYIHNLRSKTDRKSGPLSSDELHGALISCAKVTQAHYFKEDIPLIKQDKPLRSSLRKLTPFLSEDGVVKVGGRLRHASLSIASKHPILLPSKSPLAELICDFYHKFSCHSGYTTCQALIQKRWWILSLRSLLKSKIFHCLPCYKLKTKPANPFMADLPPARVQVSSPFHVTGLDYFGPLELKESQRKNARSYKAWGLIFVCFATKAVHIELVTSLTTENFLSTIERFCNRRGLPSEIHSDCQKTFIGASKELKEVQKWLIENNESIFSSLASKQVKFVFNCPKAPSMGGLWESAVGSFKKLMYRSIGTSKFTFEEFSTIFSRIEAVLNSRPLTFLSTTPDDGVDYLSPGHFLIGKPLLSFPELHIPEDLTLRSRWQRIRQLVQSFWKRWSKEYLHTQIQRSKWTEKCPNLQPGQVVLISDVQYSPLCWNIGRISKVFPGDDKIVRVAEVRTANGVYTRPVHKLVPLPVH